MNKFEVVSRFADCGIELPTRSTAYSAGYDLAVAEDVVIPPMSSLMDSLRNFHSGPITLAEMASYTKKIGAKPTLVSTGLKCQINEGWYLKLVVRSSLPLKHWLILANSEGIIDGDYYNNPDNEGEIFLQLINLSPFPIQLKKGDKIGQGIFVRWGLAENDSYGAGSLRQGGFGSTTTTNVTTSGYVAAAPAQYVDSPSNDTPYIYTETNLDQQLTFEDLNITF